MTSPKRRICLNKWLPHSEARILRLKNKALNEALTAAQAIGDESSRSEALAPLAPHLPEELINEALTAAQAPGSWCDSCS
jgi:hypothetical protein